MRADGGLVDELASTWLQEISGMERTFAAPMMIASHDTWPKHGALPCTRGIEDLRGLLLRDRAGRSTRVRAALAVQDHVHFADTAC